MDAAERKTLRRQFKRVDTNGSGSIDEAEFGALLEATTGETPSAEEVSTMMASLDKDSDGTLSFDEFCGVLSMAKNGELPFAGLNEAMSQFDSLLEDEDEEMGLRQEAVVLEKQPRALSLGAPSQKTHTNIDEAVDERGCLSAVADCFCSSDMLYSKDALRSFLERLCSCLPPPLVLVLVVLLLPPIWLWMSLKLLLLPCLSIYLWRVGGAPQRLLYGCLASCFGQCGCLCDMSYSDPQMECKDGVLDGFNDSEGGGVSVEVEWKRPHQVFSGNSSKLFAEGVSPDDVDQGSLGDCWLLAAFASAAEFPGMIRRAFLTTETNWRGRYELVLFDGAKKKWTKVVIDDRIPCAKGTCDPVFCKPSGNELWVCLLEKAFAKFVGGYHNLSGGFSIWALQVLTGDVAYTLRRDTGDKIRWLRDDMVFSPTPENKRAVKWKNHLGEDGDVEEFSDDAVFKMLLTYDAMGFVMTAASSNEGRQSGIVGGHAYSLVTVKKINKFKLLRLRNPWGHFEWDGDWSDASPLWDEHSSVKRACHHDRENDDGMFWMAWSDFLKFFDSVDVLQRTIDLHDVYLETHDELGCAGPACGCVEGCAKYYCMCRGARKLCCSRTSHSNKTVKAQDGCFRECYKCCAE